MLRDCKLLENGLHRFALREYCVGFCFYEYIRKVGANDPGSKFSHDLKIGRGGRFARVGVAKKGGSQRSGGGVANEGMLQFCDVHAKCSDP